MTRERQLIIWAIGFIAFGFLFQALSSMLLPFVAGLLVAYFLDPLADRMERAGLSRALSAVVILMTFFAIGVAVLMTLIPMLGEQIVNLARLAPDLIDGLREHVVPYLRKIKADLPDETLANIRDNVANLADNAAGFLSGILVNMWSGGLALFNGLSFFIITPVVAFYLIRDWDLITAKIDSWLPRLTAPVIRQQFRNIDMTLAAFVRGQALVCLTLALFYSVGLSLIGLQSGLLVGLAAGMISFIPYIGASVGLCIGLAVALFQFSEWMPIILVGLVFLTGQTAESYVLTPKLVGDRVGLHPVWIIFALLAGGALFGLTGVLVALPVAAVIGVLVRFAVEQYLQSPLYSGDLGEEE